MNNEHISPNSNSSGLSASHEISSRPLPSRSVPHIPPGPFKPISTEFVYKPPSRSSAIRAPRARNSGPPRRGRPQANHNRIYTFDSHPQPSPISTTQLDAALRAVKSGSARPAFAFARSDDTFSPSSSRFLPQTPASSSSSSARLSSRLSTELTSDSEYN